MQEYYLNEVPEGKLEVIKEETSTGRYKKSTTNIAEYEYSIESVYGKQIVKSKVETIGENNFVVIYRHYEGFYSADVRNALQLAYESAALNLAD